MSSEKFLKSGRDGPPGPSRPAGRGDLFTLDRKRTMPDWAPDKRIFRRFWSILSDIIKQNGGRNITNFVHRQFF